jgi:hypothetical protein
MRMAPLTCRTARCSQFIPQEDLPILRRCSGLTDVLRDGRLTSPYAEIGSSPSIRGTAQSDWRRSSFRPVGVFIHFGPFVLIVDPTPCGH